MTLDPSRAQTKTVHLAGIFQVSLYMYFTCSVKDLLAQNADRHLSWDIKQGLMARPFPGLLI